ncbi:SDR family NAD(P)-dependent oxidoreductase [Agromyces sp. H66]|uniref:SDR family NAD(P)-dependent oxidoreductase n=1 Tax=Agromyces sp. H66 TaxID=2529859 RepID=UPI00145A9385|nr:SDR family NAD(P)-dependent oxidoreductase [Agromyces sp. H66]
MTDHDINSPTVLLTGPTRGIGAEMLDRLIDHPARPRLVLLARDPHALDRVVGRARAAGRDAVGITIDLADLDSVDAALQQLRDRIAGGEVAAPNAAMLSAGAQFGDRRGTSAQGIEQTFAVDVVAQHALVRGILPILAPRGHVVLMGSGTHRGRAHSFGLVPSPRSAPPEELARTDRTDRGATRHAGGRAYAESKLALVTLAHAWARRAEASGHRLNTYDPGLVPGTGLVRDLPGYVRWTWEHVMPAMALLPGASTPRATARHAIDLVMGDRHADLHDGYVEIGKVTRPAGRTFDRERQEELFSWIEERHPDRAVDPTVSG